MTDHVEPLMEPQPANQLHSAAGYQSDTGRSFLRDHRVLLSCYVNHLKEEEKKKQEGIGAKQDMEAWHFPTHTSVQCASAVCQCVVAVIGNAAHRPGEPKGYNSSCSNTSS